MKKELILKLFELKLIKFGSFTLKSGLQSPIYLDIREVISYPDLMKILCDLLWDQVSSSSFDLLCGVPYTALPIASYLSITHHIPMVLKRKEAKAYGTKKLVEGIYSSNDLCLIIEDVISTGSSVLETLQPLQELGIRVEEIAVIIDRGQGGRERLEKAGLKVHALLTLPEILDTLHTSKCITQEQFESTHAFIHEASLL